MSTAEVSLINPEAVSYVQKCRSIGFSDAEIETALKSAGYPSDVIHEALQTKPAPRELVPTPPAYEHVVEEHTPPPQAIPLDSRPLSEGMLGRLWEMTVRPRNFFNKLADESVPYRALSQFLFTAGALSLFWFTIVVVVGPDFATAEQQTGILSSLVVAVATLCLFPLIALVWHAFVVFLGGQRGPGVTVELAVYSILPAVLLSIVPGINVLFIVYSWLLQYRGLVEMQKAMPGVAIFLVVVFQFLLAGAAQGLRFIVTSFILPYF